ncbi:hypothetical protein [Lichenihabitans sp. PAMC28606]|nr:hypothetical protein [Lichenihabitans sp. PAMC28606]
MGFTSVLAQEVGADGITANCVRPGIIVPGQTPNVCGGIVLS